MTEKRLLRIILQQSQQGGIADGNAVKREYGAGFDVTLSGNGFTFNASGESYVRFCSRLKEALQASGKLEEAFSCPDLLRAIQAKRAR